MTWKCDRRIWRGKNGKLYEDGDPRGWELVAALGDELESKPSVEKSLKLTEDKAQKPSEDKSLKPTEDKAQKPSEDKSVKAGKNKEVPEPFPPLDEEDTDE